MSFSWDEAVALTLPGVSMGAGARGSTSHQVRGKQIVSQGRTPGDFVLRATREEIGVLIERAWWDRASGAQRARHGGERP
ncbi:hypothetical protein BH11PSE6_BH11PSE6_04920 [soil metagenome]